MSSLLGYLAIPAFTTLLLVSCTSADPSAVDGDDVEAAGEAHGALTPEQCNYFDVNGAVQLCHRTSSATKPYTIIRVSEQACINAHSAHAGDYVTSTNPSSPSYDPTCGGQGCLAVNAPCDPTVPCCDGLTCQSGTCTDVNECALGTDNCDANAACTNTTGSFTCACNAGYEGDGVTCTEIDECALGTDNCDANAACTNTPGSFTCACNAGYEGDGVTCTHVNECDPSPCQNGGTCIDGEDSYTCQCPAGFTGTNCEIDIDDCAGSPCLNGGTCVDGVNSYTCSCADGYQGSVCQNLVGCVSGLPTPTGFWKGENNAADSSGNGYNGTLRSGVAFAAGQVGQAFSTQNGDMAIATTAAPFANLNDMTVDMWININDATGYQVLFSRNRTTGGTGYAVSLSGGQLGFAVNNGAGVNQGFSAPVSLSLHTWYHVTVSRKANVVKLYVDCALVGQTSSFFSGTISLSPTLPVTIGSEDTVANRRFRGLIDEAAFYPAQLSDAEISSICAAASAGVCIP
ncbi:LamG-like jellyroll fold domain-containing protein [Sorangium sp. So ce1000]|uniref:LamG-like jellyroll fold domain-containing protein n=1 Tax=Sorangium sp. So ce1000 TaxID=3133325 RepID=UPI003F600A31